MEKMEMILMIVCAVAAPVIGLTIVVLQKKGIFRPVLTQTANGFNFVSGGTITILGTGFGVLMIDRYSTLWAFLYAAVVAVLYIIIQVAFRK